MSTKAFPMAGFKLAIESVRTHSVRLAVALAGATWWPSAPVRLRSCGICIVSSKRRLAIFQISQLISLINSSIQLP